MLNFHELNTYKKISFIFVNIEALIGVVGILGNMLSIRVFSQKDLKNHSYSFYWRILSISDSFVLISTFKLWSNHVLGVSLQTISPLFCTLNEYHTYVASFISTWMLALISFDRFLVIVYPNRFKLFRRRPFQSILVFIVVLYSILVNLRIPLNNRLEVFESFNSSKTITIIICHLPRSVHNWNFYLILSNTFVVNCVINCALDIKVFFSIRAARVKSHRIVNGLLSTVRDRKFAITSIVLNVSSSLLKLPFALGIYVSGYYNLSRDQHHMILTITGAIAVLDNCDLFFVNLFVNSIFYREFHKIFLCRFK